MTRHKGRLGADRLRETLTRLIQGRCEGNSRLGKNPENRAGLTNLMQGRCGGKNGLKRGAGTQEGNRGTPENTIFLIKPSINSKTRPRINMNINPSTHHYKLTNNARQSFKDTTQIINEQNHITKRTGQQKCNREDKNTKI